MNRLHRRLVLESPYADRSLVAFALDAATVRDEAVLRDLYARARSPWRRRMIRDRFVALFGRSP